ncbi:zonular occludens toxin domain-containing protein [Photobacterium rosenbergii]|uniref:Zonular occludens toxin domain-containing protein n=1 Tax=Photobacterium rosenbergii TaxID=294936 RepID=A0ABU3ZFJ1_9GAMM|nr:zonular occludens toxin domain-containing protein [Photobacterium rosenbergii]MDV5168812.1 zonular occludens toxin domain-containing protein [Photobacterium rosenbergii]
MATIIRHGAAGSYKSACAVWFDLLPALRSGRVVVTNVEGMQDIKTIEQRLGERFPVSARIIRISSMSENGIKLWQNWYNWCPVGAMILIDEAQDIYNKTVGFDMARNVYQGIGAFRELLPKGYVDFYQAQLNDFKPESVPFDDTGESVIDYQGNVLLPKNFNMAFMRHRKYNWDITLCTPDIKQIPSEIKGVSELAIHHRSKDSFALFKRRPRLWEHDPRSAATKPSKDDSTKTIKVPVAVHLMYSSTVTGQITKSGAGTSIMRQPKFLLFLLTLIVCIFFFGKSVYEIATRDNTDDVVSDNQATANPSVPDGSPATQADTLPSQQVEAAHQMADVPVNDIRARFNNAAASAQVLDHPPVDSPLPQWPYDITKLYVSGVHVELTDYKKAITTIVFEQVSRDGQRGYVHSTHLKPMGFEFQVIDPCFVLVEYGKQQQVLMCNPTNTHQETQQDESYVITEPDPSPLGGLIDDGQFKI